MYKKKHVFAVTMEVTTVLSSAAERAPNKYIQFIDNTLIIAENRKQARLRIWDCVKKDAFLTPKYRDARIRNIISARFIRRKRNKFAYVTNLLSHRFSNRRRYIAKDKPT